MKRFYFLLYMIVSSAFGVSCKAEDVEPVRFVKQREAMVRMQIESRGIKERATLDALRKVERHRFVPQKYQKHAYEDHPLPIGEDQTISQPYIVALMTEVLDLKKNEKVLEIGTGSGYQAAVLGEICEQVYTIEIIDTLGKRAKKLLADLKYDNINVKIGDGYKGWEEHSPFDAIIVTCAPTHIPEPLKKQLAEGGKMVIPVGEAFTQKLVLLTKKNGKIIEKAIIPVRFVPMLNENGKKY
ncbi:protein-L-isoaspartate(D-aspartate) O-methyltransferase [Desulfococcaceae bacterium HSG9]|nr:protein-L-isoaspartate(D-aspartate) O-methyltransferase [Desulfococcaceae bacterium HSG9]